MKEILKNVAIEAGLGYNVMKCDLVLLEMFNFRIRDKTISH